MEMGNPILAHASAHDNSGSRDFDWFGGLSAAAPKTQAEDYRRHAKRDVTARG